jgi:hypothetical protein
VTQTHSERVDKMRAVRPCEGGDELPRLFLAVDKLWGSCPLLCSEFSAALFQTGRVRRILLFIICNSDIKILWAECPNQFGLYD